ncbi:hypothetical protein J437_LFUL004825 [Ladona fulva]|uniref:MD-2-related lipid-recognition domain-containing protein n=1 Tax=Ladona fulva TaxID=123851 RepID=A0A8K0K1I1_LADFU|nr:hypothetical protein J437_LFUL004825 [Ladona fulva]
MEEFGCVRILVLLISAITLGSCVNIEDCGSKIGNFSNVAVTNCDHSPVCILRRNTNVTIQFDFTPHTNIQKVKSVVHGIEMGIPIPFPFPDADACSHGLNCPLFKGKTYSYRATLQVLKKYPRVRVQVKWELKNEDKRDIACLLIPAQIK